MFFWGFIALAFAGYAGAVSCDQCNDDSNLYPLLIACFGFICSIAWLLANLGSKYWQKNWEQIINELEDKKETELGYLFYRTYNNKIHFSVSKLTISLSVLSSLIWFILIIKNINFSDATDVAIGIGTLLFTVIMICFTKSSKTKVFKKDELYIGHKGTKNKAKY